MGASSDEPVDGATDPAPNPSLPSPKINDDPPNKQHSVRLKDPEPDSKNNSKSFTQDTEKGDAEPATPPAKQKSKSAFVWPSALEWIPSNFCYSKLKPVIRCAVAAWISSLLFLIPAVEKFMGQASFLILIAAFITPPSEPFMGVFEREIIMLLFVNLGWAFSSLGIFLANLTRTNVDYSASLGQALLTGEFIEANPSIILAAFVFLGTAFFLYVRARQGPGPYLFACIFGCITIDISLTTAALIPYPYYAIGQAIVIPLIFHSAISLVCSICIFPATMSAAFTNRLIDVLDPLKTAMEMHKDALSTPTTDDAFAEKSNAITPVINKVEGGLVPLSVAARLLPADLIYCRFAPTDFGKLHDLVRRLTVRANGMGLYFTLIDPTRARFPITPGTSRAGTPQWGTPHTSRPPSPTLEKQVSTDQTVADGRDSPKRSQPSSPALDSTSFSGSVNPSLAHSHRHSGHHHHLASSLLHLHLPHRKHEAAVGVFESQRYLNLESLRFHDPEAEEHTCRSTELLYESCGDLLGECRQSLADVAKWLDCVRHHRLDIGKGVARKHKNMRQDKLASLTLRADSLRSCINEFQETKRHRVLDFYRPAFNSDSRMPPHRYLFHCYVYQYHLLRFSCNTLDMLEEIVRLEATRQSCKLWTPAQRLFQWNIWQPSEETQNNDDENPDVVVGIDYASHHHVDLGVPRRRDPDALPPRNVFQWVGRQVYMGVSNLSHGNPLFAIKASILTLIMSLPSFIKSSAGFAYSNRFVWAIFMAQLTLSRFRGDTVFGTVVRIGSTFFGGILGMVMFYMSSGTGTGNPYGLAAVFAVFFGFLFFARLYYPGHPMTIIIFLVTSILIVGYSYQGQHINLPGNVGVGWQVAWRRFVLVTAGVVAAFIFSLLPPSTTIRRFQRHSLGTTNAELGSIYCSIVSFANSHRQADTSDIVKSLLAIRSKLNRTVAMRVNAIYEFSLRGPWPAKRYHEVSTLQLQLAYSLSHLMSTLQNMEPAWAHAFLTRTRFSDSTFQGDVLAVFSMLSTALRTGMPLPQITPCPLIDRFTFKYHGLNIIHKEAEEDFGLPRTLTLDTLANEQYLYFCVGVSMAYGIVWRLDRLMVAVKEIVGEQYYIEGIGPSMRPPTSGKSTGVELGPRTETITLRPPKTTEV